MSALRDWIEGIWKAFTPPKPKRLELRYLSYTEADKLIQETKGAWTVAKEDNSNRVFGMVYLELLEQREDLDLSDD